MEKVWLAEEIAAAYAAGLVQVINANEFAPEQEITREQMALLLVRAYEYKHGLSIAESDKLQGYADHANVSSWAASGVDKAIQAGLMREKSEQVFDPKSDKLRAEAAQAIWNLIKSK
jgi:hypothetical protein